MRVWGLRHLLLGTHGTAVVGGASAQVLLLQEPLVDVLVEHALGCLGQWWPTTPSANSTLLLWPLPWSTLSGLELWTSCSSGTSTWPSVLPLKSTH